jgi:hypothetical protein
MGREIRLRLRFHSEIGKDLFSLLSPFGLDQEHVEVARGGELTGRTRCAAWIAQQRLQEESRVHASAIH